MDVFFQSKMAWTLPSFKVRNEDGRMEQQGAARALERLEVLLEDERVKGGQRSSALARRAWLSGEVALVGA